MDLLITGFRNKEEIDTFIDWYEGQGEQDAALWFELRQEEGLDVRDWIGYNKSYPMRYDGDTTVMSVEEE